MDTKHQIYSQEGLKDDMRAEKLTSEDESKELLGDIDFKDTSSITVPESLIDHVIGQDEAVEVIKKAARQRRHVMLIGSPGTGKSMLGKAMSELLPVEELQDVLVYANPEDNNTPRVRIVPAGRGKQIVDAQKMEARKKVQTRNMFLMLIVMALIVYAYYTGQLLFGDHCSSAHIPFTALYAAQRGRHGSQAPGGQQQQEEGTLCGCHRGTRRRPSRRRPP